LFLFVSKYDIIGLLHGSSSSSNFNNSEAVRQEFQEERSAKRIDRDQSILYTMCGSLCCSRKHPAGILLCQRADEQRKGGEGDDVPLETCRRGRGNRNE